MKHINGNWIGTTYLVRKVLNGIQINCMQIFLVWFGLNSIFFSVQLNIRILNKFSSQLNFIFPLSQHKIDNRNCVCTDLWGHYNLFLPNV